MTTRRAERIAEAMKEEIADIIRSELRDPTLGLVSVVRVEVSSDLAYAKVFVSALSDEKGREAAMEALRKASGFIRGEVTRRLRLRVAPELAFHYDKSVEYGIKLAKIFDEIKEEGSRSDRAPDVTGSSAEGSPR